MGSDESCNQCSQVWAKSHQRRWLAGAQVVSRLLPFSSRAYIEKEGTCGSFRLHPIPRRTGMDGKAPAWAPFSNLCPILPRTGIDAGDLRGF